MLSPAVRRFLLYTGIHAALWLCFYLTGAIFGLFDPSDISGWHPEGLRAVQGMKIFVMSLWVMCLAFSGILTQLMEPRTTDPGKAAAAWLIAAVHAGGAVVAAFLGGILIGLFSGYFAVVLWSAVIGTLPTYFFESLILIGLYLGGAIAFRILAVAMPPDRTGSRHDLFTGLPPLGGISSVMMVPMLFSGSSMEFRSITVSLAIYLVAALPGIWWLVRRQEHLTAVAAAKDS